MRIPLICFFLLISLAGTGQRFSTGFSIGTTAFLQTRLKSNYIIPSTSYNIYYTANDKKDGKPIFDQYINGLSLGLNFGIDYKRWMITTEISGSYNKIKTPVYYPAPLSDLLDDSWGYYRTMRQSFNFPLLISYKLSSKANGYFLQGGIQYSLNKYDELHGYSDSQVPSAISLFISQTELLGTIYNTEWNFWNGIIGIGYKKNDRYLSSRFIRRILGSEIDYPSARFWQIDIIYSQTLNFQKLKKGHIIYTD